jgi:hypothetical protein
MSHSATARTRQHGLEAFFVISIGGYFLVRFSHAHDLLNSWLGAHIHHRRFLSFMFMFIHPGQLSGQIPCHIRYA